MRARRTYIDAVQRVRRMGRLGSRHRGVLITEFGRSTDQILAASTGILLVTGNDPY
jgi:hypothetical protein